MSAAKPPSSELPVERNRVADQIFHYLKDQILTGSHARGAKLPAERELAERYRVSIPTVREAIRGLTTVGLVEVRHGSGAYVTASGDALIAMSLGAVIQLEGVGIAQVLQILAILNEHAAACACQHATAADHARLRQAVASLKAAATPAEAAAGVREFHRAFVTAAHNPLLSVLCGYLSDLQTELATELAEGSMKTWKRILGGLQDLRDRLVQAIEQREREAAIGLTREFHLKAIKLITSLPKARESGVRDPKLHSVLSSMLSRMN